MVELADGVVVMCIACNHAHLVDLVNFSLYVLGGLLHLGSLEEHLVNLGWRVRFARG